MEMQYFKDYSPALGRDMECKIYGHAGRPMLYIPCQDGRFFDFENFHMADTLAPWIDAGKIMVISIDTMDKETWSDTQGDPYWRIRRYEQWLRYIVEEAVPKIQYLAKERNGWDDLPGVIAFGCSLGATHAVNLYLRRPDVFCGCLALSGIYTAHYGFGNYRNASAAAVGLFYRPNERTMMSLGWTMGDGRNMINAGISVKLGRGDVYTRYSKVEMANQIKDLKEKNDKMQAENKEMRSELDELKAQVAALAAKK